MALHTLVTVLSALYLVSMMFALGLELGGAPKESKRQKRDKRLRLLVGLFVNLVVLPLVAFGITHALHASSDVSVALLLLAASPGGRYTPHLVKLGGGDTPLAIELTLFLAKLTCFTAVPTAKWMLTVRTLEIHELPFLVQLVVLQLVPLYAGKWLRRAHRPFGDRCMRPAHWASIAVALLTFALVVSSGDRGILPLLEGRGWLAVAAVGVLSPIVAYLLAGRHEGARRAFSIGANARELALALMMASVAFPDRGVHTALFGIWSLFTLSSAFFAAGMRRFGGAGRADRAGDVRAGGRAPAAPAGVRSAPAR